MRAAAGVEPAAACACSLLLYNRPPTSARVEQRTWGWECTGQIAATQSVVVRQSCYAECTINFEPRTTKGVRVWYRAPAKLGPTCCLWYSQLKYGAHAVSVTVTPPPSSAAHLASKRLRDTPHLRIGGLRPNRQRNKATTTSPPSTLTKPAQRNRKRHSSGLEAYQSAVLCTASGGGAPYIPSSNKQGKPAESSEQ